MSMIKILIYLNLIKYLTISAKKGANSVDMF